MFNFIINKEYIQIPVDFIINKMKGANGAFVKVYLYMLWLASNNKSASPAEIARELDLTENDIINACEYWKENGAIIQENSNIYIDKKISHAPIDNLNENIGNDSEKNTEKEANNKIINNPELADMLNLAQEIFGRFLSPTEMQTLYWFHDGLGFSPEAILLLLEYCVSKGKLGMKYIEAVAISWSEKGAVDADAVVKIIQDEEQRTGYIYSIRKIMGISDRALSQNEEKYLMKWKNEKGMSEEMVALAYEYCIIQTAKLSFPYMDKIIERWAKQGITTVTEAEIDNKKYQNGKLDKKNQSADYSDLELLTKKRRD